MLLVALLRVLCTLPTAVLAGIGEMAVGYRWDTIGLAAGTAAICGAVLVDADLRGLVLASFVSPLVLLFGAVFSIVKRIPLRSGSKIIPTRRHYKDLLGYGAQIQVASLATIAIHPLSRLLVSRFGNLLQVSALDFAEKLVLGLRGLLVAALAPAVPAAARAKEGILENSQRRDALIRRSLGWFAVPFALLLAIAIGPVLDMWLGTQVDLPFARFAVRSYLAAYVPNAFLVFAFFTMQGAGYAAGAMYSQVVGAAVALSLGLLLGGVNGPRGVVVAVALGVLAASCVTLLAYRHWQGLQRQSGASK